MDRIAWKVEVGNYGIRAIAREDPPGQFTVIVEENGTTIFTEAVVTPSIEGAIAWAIGRSSLIGVGSTRQYGQITTTSHMGL
jgi:hypothetical protein